MELSRDSLFTFFSDLEDTYGHDQWDIRSEYVHTDRKATIGAVTKDNRFKITLIVDVMRERSDELNDRGHYDYNQWLRVRVEFDHRVLSEREVTVPNPSFLRFFPSYRTETETYWRPQRIFATTIYDRDNLIDDDLDRVADMYLEENHYSPLLSHIFVEGVAPLSTESFLLNVLEFVQRIKDAEDAVE
jgi:hypothetical protein